MVRPGLALIVLAVVTLLVVAVWSQSREPEPPPFVELASRTNETRLADTRAGRVRFVRMKVQPDERNAAEIESAPAVAEIEHLGPLAETEQASLATSCQRYLAMMESRFRDRDTEATDSSSLLQEAMLLYDLTLAKVAVDAVESGSYIVVAQEDPTPLSLPNSEVLTTGATRAGDQVNISIVMPHDKYPRLKEARQYLKDMRTFDDGEKARRFNSLPDAERAALVMKINSLRQKESLTDEDRRFLRETLGRTNELREGPNLLVAFRLR